MRRPLIARPPSSPPSSAGCGDEPTAQTGDHDRDGRPRSTTVEVTGEPGEKPTLEFDQPLELDETPRRGTSRRATARRSRRARSVTLRLPVRQRRATARSSSTSYEGEPADARLRGRADGRRVQGPRRCSGGEPGARGHRRRRRPRAPTRRRASTETDTLLFFAEIHDVRMPLTRAEGEAVEPEPGLPTVELAEDGAPTITVPDTSRRPSSSSQPLIEGDGASRRGRADDHGPLHRRDLGHERGVRLVLGERRRRPPSRSAPAP